MYISSSNIRVYLVVIILALAISRGSSKNAKNTRNGKSIVQKVYKSKQGRNGSISFLRHPSPVVSELTPVLEPNLYNPLSGEGRRKTQCKEIPPQFSLCYDIGYKKMHLPNLRGHDSIGELVKQSNEWTPLLATRCHPEARKFLCSVFAPVCVKDFSDPIPPCQSLCTAVRDSCSPAMAVYDFSWPTMFNCSQFPSDDTLCIPSEQRDLAETKPTPSAAKVCFTCRRKKISRSFKKKLCSFDFIIKSRVKRVISKNGDIKLTLKKKSRRILKWLDNINSKSTKSAMAKKNIVWMTDGVNCTCDVLQAGVRTSYLMAGWYQDDKLRLYSITKWRKSDKRLSKLLRRKRCGAVSSKNKRSEV